MSIELVGVEERYSAGWWARLSVGVGALRIVGIEGLQTEEELDL